MLTPRALLRREMAVARQLSALPRRCPNTSAMPHSRLSQPSRFFMKIRLAALIAALSFGSVVAAATPSQAAKCGGDFQSFVATK
jgi:hypothetical protein